MENIDRPPNFEVFISDGVCCDLSQVASISERILVWHWPSELGNTAGSLSSLLK